MHPKFDSEPLRIRRPNEALTESENRIRFSELLLWVAFSRLWVHDNLGLWGMNWCRVGAGVANGDAQLRQLIPWIN